MSKRIQRKRTKGWRMPEGCVYVGRGSKWGNPFVKGEYKSPKGLAWLFRIWLSGEFEFPMYPEKLAIIKKDIAELRGKDLCCWCKESDSCHADVLLEMANKPEEI